jgi:hypothetical protein
MTTLLQQIEEMRQHVNELADGEHSLVKALGEALSRTDQKLLQDVRQVAAEHEMRRGMILGELQSLASRIGMFTPPAEPVAQLEEAPPRNLAPYELHDQSHSIVRGDWRQAASNIHDDLEYQLNGRAA